MENTVVVITSDHGKEIGEHGIVGHGHSLYEEMLQVPLVIGVPRSIAARANWQAGERDDRAMELVDVMPTVLDALGIAPPPNMQGLSAMVPPTQARIRLAEVDSLAIKYAMRVDSLKTIHGPQDVGARLPNLLAEESFDLAADPGEQRPLAADPARVQAVEKQFDRLRSLSSNLGSVIEAEPLGDSTAAQLRVLGYAALADG